MAKDKAAAPVNPEMEKVASQKARDRAMNARWDLNIAIFLFAVLILVIILVTYTKAGIALVAPIAGFGLAMVWVVGWQRGRQLYQRFYEEEIATLELEANKNLKATVKETIEETIEAQVQKALRKRGR